MVRLVRSFLFVPGNNKRFIDKAKSLNVDIICLDLEDSVISDGKESSRQVIIETLKSRSEFRGEVYVRINSFDSNNMQGDLEAVVQKGVDGIVIPKVNDSNEVIELSKRLSVLECERSIKEGVIEIIPSIESAKGVVNAYEIARASPRVSAIIFGVFESNFTYSEIK